MLMLSSLIFYSICLKAARGYLNCVARKYFVGMPTNRTLIGEGSYTGLKKLPIYFTSVMLGISRSNCQCC